jgi:hypothetical protein
MFTNTNISGVEREYRSVQDLIGERTVWKAKKNKVEFPSPSKYISDKPCIIDLYGELVTREDHGYAVRN